MKSYLLDFGFGEGEVFYDVINDSYIGITVDSNGMVYEIESGLFSRVQRFSPECEFIDQWSSQSTTEEAFQTPLEIIADQNNNIYVVDIFNYSVKKFSSNGLFDSSIFQKPTEADKFWPQGIAFDSENNLFVLDGNNIVLEQRVFDSNEVINSFTIREEKTSCAGIVFDNHGYLYISNVTEHQIEKYDPSGEFIEFLGEHGNSPGKFSFPQGLAFDSNNHLYVVDQNNNRIQKLTSDGEYILHWGTKGDHPGEFNNPRGIAIDKDDNIYIADSYNHRVQLFSPNGRFLTSIGEYGVAPNMFRNPYYLCITDDYKLYVSDQNSRIQVF
ncbi:MAG: NHL repeat containing protein [Candidatus Magnetoglobus multicellularis str. Araruama]|uniref:NHL repeat containing protein n=1 Tax=Candidatus Magnetoglobus multicellularis str. Araruama TaxID=890399 RepID=A0A1V1P7P9_9BACT|nr:MAG: NHL repeat containing protein [Candidatus Magnetoglobus multicellularis str. Araruama]